MPDSYLDHRDAIVERLESDLMGPASGPEELIIERPSDRYVTGILYPQRTETRKEDDDSLAVGDEDESSSEQVATALTMRPAAAGISFAMAGDCTLQFSIHCGRYEEQRDSSTGEAGWRRVPLHARPILDPRNIVRVDLGEHGIPGLELSLKCAPQRSCVLVTAVLVNRQLVGSDESRLASDFKAFFQVAMDVEPVAGTTLPARPSRRAAIDEDGRSSALLYSHALEFAAGHTCSAEWINSPSDTLASRVSISWFPRASVAATSSQGGEHLRRLGQSPEGRCFDPQVLADDSTDLSAVLQPLLGAYEAWIAEKAEQVHHLAADIQEQGRTHLAACARALARMKGGVSRLATDTEIRSAFRLANRAMALQFSWTAANGNSLRWRPFQLGFLLLSLESVADGSHADRGVMDLVWFPTGGGKTEAYLALIAFISFHRRLRHHDTPDDGAGTAVLMRYTLRLLTTQQFQRASALMLACEHVRRTWTSGSLGTRPFSIGLWVGRDAVANTVKGALTSLAEDKPNRPDQIKNCPACKAPLHWGPGSQRAYVKVTCLNRECVFAESELPIWTVDEDVYAQLPTLIIGTIDKFAQLPRKVEAGRMFGRDVGFDPPDMILQDELHLISGPLGTLAGLYEVAVDELCSSNGVRPKVIGSTATIRRAPEQIRALFNRSVQLFPPPGLSAGDSCFAVTDATRGSRRYVAVTTAGRSAKFTLQAVSASLLQSASTLAPNGNPTDDYWTLVGYFNSLRELGGALVLMQDDVTASIAQYAAHRSEAPRALGMVSELTSRLTQAQLKDRLAELEMRVESGAAIDALLATNMLSVGLDIGRLALMVMNGQPKAVAEYIQATSRVGRDVVPGLIIAVYNNGKARDRSRYETFRTWHDTLYREVEATSVTPFSSRSRDRGLHALLVSMVRHCVPSMKTKPVIATEEAAILGLTELIAARAREVDPEEEAPTLAHLDTLLEQWMSRTHLTDYLNDWKPASSLMISSERAAAMRAAMREIGDAWPTPSSMRNVEPGTHIALLRRLKPESHGSDESSEAAE